MFDEQFYPTPAQLANYALKNVNFKQVQFVIEPSAGKGDFIEAARPHLVKDAVIDCLEIDTDLQAILKGRGFSVIGENFLEFRTWQKYDLCLMNPPFRNGEKHLLKALDLMKHGGQIVCILNAETLKNPNSNTKIQLAQKLEDYEADIEYIKNAFSEAEFKSEVEIALIYIRISDIAEQDVTERLKQACNSASADSPGRDELAENDIIKAAVKQFEISCEAGTQIFDNFRTLQKYLPGGKNTYISVTAISPEEIDMPQRNRFIRQLRYEFWKRLFCSEQMSPLMTRKIKDTYMGQLHKLRAYDFNFSNIKQIQFELSKALTNSLDEAIIEMFETLTYVSSMDNSKNIHYYNGWKTNKAFAVGKKTIQSAYGLYDSRWNSWSFWKANEFLIELEKIFTYLDGGLLGGSGVCEIAGKLDSKTYCGEFVKFKYFSVSYKKKGTMHIQFDNLDLLKKFNIFGGNKKGWLPPSYGKKCYSDLSAEEKEVIKSFEGEPEYRKTMEKPDYYLGRVGMKLLEA